MLTWVVRTWSVVVPAKRLAVAKTRLRPLTAVLGDDAASGHDALVLALLADTVSAAIACAAVAEVVVVTDDAAAAGVVRGLGARTVSDAPDAGLNPALDHGARSVVGPVAALSSDLPALRPAGAARRPSPRPPSTRGHSSPTPRAPGRRSSPLSTDRCIPPSGPTRPPHTGPVARWR